MATRVRQSRPRGRIRFAVGVDAAYSSDGGSCIAAAVRWDLKTASVAEEQVARQALDVPYVPGLLSFREAPAVLAALGKIRGPVDVILCDAHGRAHPRRFGLACHVGVLCERPTIGCAKSLLVGEYKEPAASRGASEPLVHREEVVGSVLRTRDGVRPVYVSVGHEIDLRTAERIVLEAAVRYRLPEPTRRADHVVARARVAA